jgi:hypothetical protein
MKNVVKEVFLRNSPWPGNARACDGDARSAQHGTMRVTSDFFVSALIRRANGAGAAAFLRRRGAAEAGAVFVRLDRLDGRMTLFCPASQADYGDGRPQDRRFRMLLDGEAATPMACEERIARELRFDPDLWIVEIEDREGRHFLDVAGG